MPWSPADASQHIKGLDAEQSRRWATIANAVLKACLGRGGSQSSCEGQAIRIANSKAKGTATKDGSDTVGSSENPMGPHKENPARHNVDPRVWHE